jgi:hypothetical protein
MGSQNVNVQSAFDREVFFGYLTAEFCFERFLERRKELAKYDLMITEYCNLSQVGLVEDTLDLKLADVPEEPSTSRERFFLKVLDLRNEPAILDIMRAAFAGSSPIKKFRSFQKALVVLRRFLVDGWAQGEDLGADELVPAQIACVLLANPTRLLSNYVFVHDFCAPEYYEHVYQEVTVSMLPVLKYICEKILPVPLASLHGLRL